MLRKLLHANRKAFSSNKTHTINTKVTSGGNKLYFIRVSSNLVLPFPAILLPYYKSGMDILLFRPPHGFDYYSYELLSYQHKITFHHFSFNIKIISNSNTILEIIIQCNLAVLLALHVYLHFSLQSKNCNSACWCYIKYKI